MSTDRTTGGDVHVLFCAECQRVSGITAQGWKGYRVDDPDQHEPPQIAFYCPHCEREQFSP